MGKVLIACEFSGVVRDAFYRAGHDAWSCDLEPALSPTNRHIQDDVLRVLKMDKWDLVMVAHPPCTRLCASGVRWLKAAPKNCPKEATQEEQAAWPTLTEKQKLDIMWRLLDEGCQLFSALWNADVPRIAVENPVMHGYAKERIVNYEHFAQSVQPWQFGTDPKGPDNVKKRTCLWLRNLPKLQHTGTLDGSTARDEIHKAPPGPDRWKFRSQFFPGIAQAMAEQWGALLPADDTLGLAA